MDNKIKSTVDEERRRVQKLATDAVQSKAYLYPIKGLLYFMSHKSLWQPLMSKIVPTLTLGIGIFTSMFFFTYLPQAALLALFNGPLAAFSTILLVLSESSTIFMVAAKTFLIEDSLIDTFDGTLVSKGQTELLSTKRQVKSGNNPMARLGKLASKPFQRFTPTAIIKYFMYLPLNFIPIVGTVIFIILQGKSSGPVAHERYFQLKGLDKSGKEQFIDNKRGAYTSFGIVSNLLELIPIAGIFFTFTNATGAALWAADLESTLTDNTTAPKLKEQVNHVQS